MNKQSKGCACGSGGTIGTRVSLHGNGPALPITRSAGANAQSNFLEKRRNIDDFWAVYPSSYGQHVSHFLALSRRYRNRSTAWGRVVIGASIDPTVVEAFPEPSGPDPFDLGVATSEGEYGDDP